MAMTSLWPPSEGGFHRLKYPLICNAPIAQLAEAADLKSAKCRFESDWGHSQRWARQAVGTRITTPGQRRHSAMLRLNSRVN